MATWYDRSVMWRGIGLVAVVVAIIVGVVLWWVGDEDGSRDNARAECIPTIIASRTLEPHPRPQMTFEEARRYADWAKIPTNLPSGVGITAGVDGFLSCPETVHEVTVALEGADFRIGLVEYRGSRDTNPFATPISIDGSEGELRVQENGVVILWSRNGVVYNAILNSGSNITQAEFLEILESIPE